MAFPSVTSITEEAHAAATTHVIDLPATVADNDLLIIFHSKEQGPAAPTGTPSGWTQLYDNRINSGNGRGSCYVRKGVSGDSGGTATITYAAGYTGSSQVYRIAASSWEGTLATAIDVSTVASGTSDSPDPGSVTAGWGSDDNLFIEVVHADDDDGVLGAASTNYGNLTTTTSGGGTNNSATVSTARRELAAASDDPGVATLTEAEEWDAYTLVIQPAAAASGAPLLQIMQHYY